MYTHIMLPLDGSTLSQKAERECIALAKWAGARITALHVVSAFHLHYQPWGAPRSVHRKIEKDHEDEARQRAQRMLGEVAARAGAAAVACDPVVVVGDHPYEEIIRSAQERGCDLIMMASHGHRGLDAVLLGSETAKVLTHCTVPVLVVRGSDAPAARSATLSAA